MCVRACVSVVLQVHLTHRYSGEPVGVSITLRTLVSQFGDLVVLVQLRRTQRASNLILTDQKGRIR